MFQGDVTPLGLAASLVLVGAAIGISLWQRLGLERHVAWARVRAIVQLLLVGAGLALVIDPAQPLAWSWLWVAAMTVYAGDVVRRRAPEIPRLLPLATFAFAAAGAFTLGTLFGLGIFPMQGCTVVPLYGMMIGNAMNATVLTARRTVEELRDKRPRSKPALRSAMTHAQRRGRTSLPRCAPRSSPRSRPPRPSVSCSSPAP